MDANVSTALISSGSSVIVAVTALLLNYRGFVSIERRIERVEDDLKEFNKIMKAVDIDIGRIKEHIGLKP